MFRWLLGLILILLVGLIFLCAGYDAGLPLYESKDERHNLDEVYTLRGLHDDELWKPGYPPGILYMNYGAQLVAEALNLLGTRFAMVVHSEGMDEISTLGLTKICRLIDGNVTAMELDPADFSIAGASVDDLQGGDAIANATIIRDILEGKEKGARRDVVLLNAAAAIIVANLADDFDSAIDMADTSIRDGKALSCLDKLVEVSNS